MHECISAKLRIVVEEEKEKRKEKKSETKQQKIERDGLELVVFH